MIIYILSLLLNLLMLRFGFILTWFGPAEIGGIKWSDLKTDKFGTHTLSVERATTIAVR